MDMQQLARMLPLVILDITTFKQRKPDELAKAIYEAYKTYDGGIIGTLPSKIIMTQKQYNTLLKRPEMAPLYFGQQEYNFYQVKDPKTNKIKCVMELDVRHDSDLNKDIPVIKFDELDTEASD